MKRHFLLILAFVGLVYSCTTTDSVTYGLEKVIEVSGRQGVTADDDYYYVSGSTALYKYSKDGQLILENSNPFDRLSLPANHFGDIDLYNGEIYAPIEIFIDGVGVNIQIGVYDAATLEYKYSIPWVKESGQVEVCGLAVDRKRGRVWMADWVNGSHLYCYDIATRAYLGKVALDPAPGLQQGICCLPDGRIVISSDDGNAELDEPDHLYVCNPILDADTASVTLLRTMDDFLREGEIEGLCFDGDKLLVLSNRGSRIILGMVKGFYPGYDREIHELYVYRPE